MGIFDSFQAAAAALIVQNGSRVRLTRKPAGAFDPITDQELEPSAWPAWDFDMVAFPPSMARRFGVDLTGKRAIELYIAHGGTSPAPSEVIPLPGDIVTLTGVDHTIFWSQTYDPALDGAVLTVAYAEI